MTAFADESCSQFAIVEVESLVLVAVLQSKVHRNT
ncbi:Uncharacterised protein [Vibrio cholerae]|nr:Uncharacterised protein [Vibrio cholerae]